MEKLGTLNNNQVLIFASSPNLFGRDCTTVVVGAVNFIALHRTSPYHTT